MFEFGVSNLRRLKNIEPIALKPITILVGRNSSGKSTFLRSFPLIRQSVLTRTSSPILWYGDLVDFGSFDTSVRDGDVKKDIGFDFAYDKIDRSNPYYRFAVHDSGDLGYFYGARYSVKIAHVGTKTRIREIKLSFAEPKLDYFLSFDESGALTNAEANGVSRNDLLAPLALRIGTGSLFPEIHSKLVDDRANLLLYRYHGGEDLQEPLIVYLKEKIKRLSDDSYPELAARVTSIGPIDPAKFLTQARRFGNVQWKKFLAEISNEKNREQFSEFYSIIQLSILPSLFNRTSQMLNSLLSGTLYIGPMRARSERYYRYQDLAVSEIDPDGKNFPMFLNSLQESQIIGLSRWIEELFGYGIKVERGSGSAGHISIQLTERGRASANIVDVGYGVSQILPVLAQIWWSRARKQALEDRQRPQTIIAIEQPELHLHPAHQALLANAIVGEASTGPGEDDAIRFLIETHSETFVNRLGELVGKKKVDPSKIQIVLFDTDDKDRTSKARLATFSDEGYLENWPYGFFQPAMDAI